MKQQDTVSLRACRDGLPQRPSAGKGAGRPAFSLLEMLIAVVVVVICSQLVMVVAGNMKYRAREAQSVNNIRQLAIANITYAADNGRFVRDSNDANNKRWFGSRTGNGRSGGAADVYSGTGGYLSDYLAGGAVRYCPVFLNMIAGDNKILSGSDSQHFERGTGGYGYNSVYIGRTPEMLLGGGGGGTPELGATRPKGGQGEESNTVSSPGNWVHSVADGARTVMFTSTAIVKSDQRLVETAETVPYQFLVPDGLGGSMTPTTHFRFRGSALVAWADGHVSFEKPNGFGGQNVYGGNNSKFNVGWFGPTDNNGYWNPRYSEGLPY